MITIKHTLYVLTIILSLLVSSIASAEQAKPVPVSDPFEEFDDVFDQNQETPPVADPLIAYNRFMFRVNDKLYFWILKPVATGYKKIIPSPCRVSVKNFFNNLKFPLYFVNNILQGKIKQAGTECARFVVNSTVGICGILDPATDAFNIQASKEDFGQTLGVYGCSDAIPLVLPILGFSNLRDAVGRVSDYFLDPMYYIDETEIQIAAAALEKTNYLSFHLGEYESLKADAFDPYTSFRDIYRQYRNKKIKE